MPASRPLASVVVTAHPYPPLPIRASHHPRRASRLALPRFAPLLAPALCPCVHWLRSPTICARAFLVLAGACAARAHPGSRVHVKLATTPARVNVCLLARAAVGVSSLCITHKTLGHAGVLRNASCWRTSPRALRPRVHVYARASVAASAERAEVRATTPRGMKDRGMVW
jgi:hypothetical protein